MAINLTKFCGKNGIRVHIDQPFSKGEWTYATDVHIVVRVPRLHIPQFPENKDAPDCELIFKEADENGPYEWVAVPEVEVPTVQCNACDETGK